MLEMLEAKGIPAERKSLYDDLETLRRFGFSIETRKSRTFAYYLSQRTFSPGDVALLAEAVRQAPGLSPRKVSQLLKKLGTLCSQYQAQALLSGGPVEEPPAQEETVPEPAAPSPEELLRRAIQRGVQVAFQAVTWELSSTGMALRQEEAVTRQPLVAVLPGRRPVAAGHGHRHWPGPPLPLAPGFPGATPAPGAGG